LVRHNLLFIELLFKTTGQALILGKIGSMIRMSLMIPCRAAVARLRSDGIVEVRVADNHVCSVEEAKEVSDVIRNLGEGKPAPVLRIAGKHSSIGEGVREFIASEESQKRILADAIVIRSLSQRLIGNFYLRMNRPRKPTRLFTNEKEAEAWLRQFIPSLN
jgi:hypothetical protein